MKLDEKEPAKLWLLLVIGFFGTLVLIGLLIYVFAAYSTGNATPWTAPTPLSQDEQFGIIRNAVTAAAALGVGVTLLLSYRRQRTMEVTQRISSEAQRTAAAAQVTSAEALQLGNQQHQLELLRHRDTRVAELRSRYTAAAEQLGSSAIAVRLAGIYALATLSDDWGRERSETDRQTCVEVLAAYFRMLSEEVALRSDGEDSSHSLRQAVWQVATARLAYGLIDETRWTEMTIDLSEANLNGRTLDSLLLDADLNLYRSFADGYDFYITDCTISSSGFLNLAHSRFRSVSFVNCRFEDGEINLLNMSIDTRLLFKNCAFLGTSLIVTSSSKVNLEFLGCEFLKFPKKLPPYSGFLKIKFIECQISTALKRWPTDEDFTHCIVRDCNFSEPAFEIVTQEAAPMWHRDGKQE